MSLLDRWQVAFQDIPFRLTGMAIRLTSNGHKLLALKNRYVERRAIIIGNGPSLLHTDIRKLENEITIGSNSFFYYLKKLAHLWLVKKSLKLVVRIENNIFLLHHYLWLLRMYSNQCHQLIIRINTLSNNIYRYIRIQK